MTRSLTFDRLVDGPPAVVKWLAAQGCGETRYRFDESPLGMIKAGPGEGDLKKDAGAEDGF